MAGGHLNCGRKPLDYFLTYYISIKIIISVTLPKVGLAYLPTDNKMPLNLSLCKIKLIYFIEDLETN